MVEAIADNEDVWDGEADEVRVWQAAAAPAGWLVEQYADMDRAGASSEGGGANGGQGQAGVEDVIDQYHGATMQVRDRFESDAAAACRSTPIAAGAYETQLQVRPVERAHQIGGEDEGSIHQDQHERG